MNDQDYMKLALELARKGRGYVSPNPLVGAVVVKNNKIIGRGYHKRFGENHAEINAIQDAGGDVSGSTMYVTLEPCCHFGKTPPCTNTIIERKISRVVIGAIDPNPLVSCSGVKILKNKGIEVKTGVLEDECRRINEVFFHYMATGLPFITVKYAQTLDGRIATVTGESKWISSDASLKYVHRLRADHDAIMVGLGTVVKDNPELTVRLVRGRNPLRVVADSGLDIPDDAKLLKNTSSIPTLIATTQTPAHPRFHRLADTGAQIITIKADKNGNVDLKNLFKKLAQRQISSVLVEGGSRVITSVFKNDLANRLVAVVAPKILGKGIEAVGDLDIRNLKDAKKISIQQVLRRREDIIIDGRFI